MENMKYEFLDKIKEMNSVIRITIPAKLVSYLKLKSGDTVKVEISKLEE